MHQRNRDRIREFLLAVRSGAAPHRAAEFMAPSVTAHQMVSEAETTVLRSPSNYQAHVREMLATYGPFTFEIQELIAEGDRVYARWKQIGRHLQEIDGFAPSGKEITEIASATYRLVDGLIVEYWIQIDREGLRIQLERNKGKV